MNDLPQIDAFADLVSVLLDAGADADTAGCLSASETTQLLLSGTGIEASLVRTGNPTPSAVHARLLAQRATLSGIRDVRGGSGLDVGSSAA